MLEARALLDWHLKKVELLTIEKKLHVLRKREEDLTDKKIQLKRNIQSLGEPTSCRSAALRPIQPASP